jgi:hypothetical protein
VHYTIAQLSNTPPHAAVQINMDRQLEELKQQVLSAQQAQQEAESKLAAQQEQHSAEMAQLQEEFAQALQAALKLAEEQEASKAQHQTNAEDQMREMQVEYEKQTLQRETEWSGKSHTKAVLFLRCDLALMVLISLLSLCFTSQTRQPERANGSREAAVTGGARASTRGCHARKECAVDQYAALI